MSRYDSNQPTETFLFNNNKIDNDDLIKLGFISSMFTDTIVASGKSGASNTQITINDLDAEPTELSTAAKVKISSANAADVGNSVGAITQVTGAVKATGTITFADQPTADDTITINGVAFTFKDADPEGAQILIGEDLAETLQNTIEVLNASENTDVNDAVYTASATVLTVTHKLYGTGGNAFTLAASAATRSGATLAGGANGVGSIAFISDNLYAGDILNINGTEFTMVASGATGNQINVDTTLSASLDNVVTALNNSVVAGVALATYSKTGTNTTLTATYNDSALDGSLFTLDATSSGSTGARTVKLYGLDKDWNFQEETITLNGQTEVETTNKFIHPYKLEVLTVGSGATNAGVIYAGTGTVTSGVPDTKYLAILAGKGISRCGFLPVPIGYKCITKSVLYTFNSATPADVTFGAFVKDFGSCYKDMLPVVISSGFIDSKLENTAFPEKTLIRLKAGAASAQNVTSYLNYKLVKGS